MPLLVCLTLLAATAHAAFFDTGISARALAMGGAFTAVADDSAALLWNPAGLAQLAHKEFTAMHLGHGDLDLGGGRTSMVAGALPAPGVDGGAIAAGILSTGDPELYNEQTVVAAVGYDIYGATTLPVAIGASIKRLSLSYEGFDAADPLFASASSTSGVTASLGAIVQISPEVKAALVLDNLAPPSLNLKASAAEPAALGTNMRLAGAYTYRSYDREGSSPMGMTEMTIAAELTRESVTSDLDHDSIRLGGEVWLSTIDAGSVEPGPVSLALRLGVALGHIGFRTLNVGGGVRFLAGSVGVQFDYAVAFLNNAQEDKAPYGSQQRASLSIAY
ncbi:hypothetical protein HN371_02170 [Candidatus Poribacteria bacterium]|jgi:hypothetical protein|nr:hypothetical protein [Candidatus Poribacteria bacterium]MBT7805062.1 hypothetical protein [Candidatus Poribacteria bacterium]